MCEPGSSTCEFNGDKKFSEVACETWHKIKKLFTKTAIDDFVMGNGHIHLSNYYLMYVKYVCVCMEVGVKHIVFLGVCIIVKEPISFFMSIRLHVSVWLPPEGFPWNSILGNFMNICWETPDLVEIRQKYQGLHMKTSAFYSCWQHKFAIKAYFVALIFILLTVTCTSTIHNTMLHFRCNSSYMNAPHCYAICTLLILLYLVHILLFPSSKCSFIMGSYIWLSL